MTDENYKKELDKFVQMLKAYSANSNMIRDYIGLLQEITDSPIEYHLSASLFVLSTITANRLGLMSAIDQKLFSTKDEGINGRPMNMWFIIMGKSRIARKTSAVIKKVEEIIEELDINKVTQGFTVPHLITQLCSMVKNEDPHKFVHAVWIFDEWSLFFDLMSKKDSYLMEAEAFLSKMYDGKSYSAGTEKRGKEEIPNPFFNIFLASTNNLPTKFKKDAFEQGFYNRFIFVPAERMEKKRLNEELTKEQKEKASIIIEWLWTVKRLNGFFFLSLDEDAKKLYDQCEDEYENKIGNEELGFKESYYGGIPNFVFRVAGLFRINRLTVEELEKLDPITSIEKKDMEVAVQYGKLISLWLEQTLQMRVKYGGVASPINTDEEYIAALLNLYKEKNVRELPQNHLRTHSKIPSKKMEEVLDGFAHRAPGQSKGGRTPVMWVLNEDTKL